MGERKRRVHARALAGFPLLCIICLMLFGCQSVSRAPGGDSADTQAEQPPAQPAQTEGDEVPQQEDVADDPEEETAVAGDLNGDGRINEEDAEVFADALETMKGEEGFNPDLDFDGDGLISHVDYQTWWDLVFGT